MSPEVKAARERCEIIVEQGGDFGSTLTGRLDAEAVRSILAALDEAEARAEVLAAECRASRANDACYRYCEYGTGEPCEDQDWADASDALSAARSSTDAAGSLEGK